MVGTNGHRPAATLELPALHSKDAELAVLGSILIDPAAIWQISDFLSPADFRGELTSAVYGEMVSMASSRVAIDLLTLGQRLEGKAGPPSGWTPWLIGLLNEVPTSMHIVEYARVVESYAVRRRLRMAGEKAANAAYSDGDLESSLSTAEASIFSVRQGRSVTGIKTAREVSASALSHIEQRRKLGGEMSGLPSGFIDLDRTLSGFIAPYVYVLAGRPGMGKSAFAGNIAAHLCKLGKRVLFFAVEMTARQVFQRMIAVEAGLPLADVRDGRLNHSEMARVYEASAQIGDWPLFIDDTPGIRPSQLRAKAMRTYAEHGLDFVIVDHLHEMAPDAPKAQRNLELGDMMRGLKETAKLVNAPLLVAAQLSRGLESRGNKKPTMSDLRESGSIEEVAYAVLFLYREHYHDETANENTAELIVAKNRDGSSGSIGLYWNSKRAQFGNLQRHEVKL